MKSFIEQAQFYAVYHQKPITRYMHLIGVPLIVFSLMIFFAFVHLVIPGVMDLTLACILTILLLVYYFYLNWFLALVITPILGILLWLAHLVSHAGPTSSALWVFIWTFILGWTLQLIGHFLENKRPALMGNLCQLLIAPLFLTAELFFMSGYMQKLKQEIYGNIDESETIKPEKSESDDKF
ncbi:DUF962 domain-containing protein [Legionella fairfieldensis]|uniref:Mpo1 family 2-hydroxy fatty acid dioxygenase n=1 Tax=Legionella fairfieldensis TaxID=45064 RepID=UPI00048D585F|nr:Mpo1-like protein [Legionella fairfieldensis]